MLCQQVVHQPECHHIVDAPQNMVSDDATFLVCSGTILYRCTDIDYGKLSHFNRFNLTSQHPLLKQWLFIAIAAVAIGGEAWYRSYSYSIGMD